MARAHHPGYAGYYSYGYYAPQPAYYVPPSYYAPPTVTYFPGYAIEFGIR